MTIQDYIKAAASFMKQQGKNLASEIGMSYSVLSKWRSNVSIPSIETLMRIQDATGMNLDDVDPRINRAWLYLRTDFVTKFMADNDITIFEFADAAGVFANTVNNWMIKKYGYDITFTRIDTILTMVDVIDGKIPVIKHQRKDNSKATEASVYARKLAKGELDGTDNAIKRDALRIFREYFFKVNPNKFGFCESSRNIFEFETDNYSFEIDMNKKNPTFKAVFKRTGRVSVERSIYA